MPVSAEKRKPLTRVAVALLRDGRLTGGPLDKQWVRDKAGIPDGTFRGHAKFLGGRQGRAEQQLRFFSSEPRRLAFGPGAGLALGISIGTSSLRAELVDANGWGYHAKEAPADPDQLGLPPARLFSRIRQLAEEVLRDAYDDPRLTVEEREEKGAFLPSQVSPLHVPLLGWGIAWPTAISREYRPLSHALRSRAWDSLDLTAEAKRRLEIDVPYSYALSDAAAAAIAVAYQQTHQPGYGDWVHPHLAMVMRIAGGVSAASIIVEPASVDPHNKILGEQSGFTKSILIAGVEKAAGEVGHIPLLDVIVHEINADRPGGLDEMVGVECSCSRSEPPTNHLESFASAGALRERIDPNSTRNEILERIRSESSSVPIRRAMEDVGTVIGEALVGPIAALNPATLTLIGSMATEDLARALRSRLQLRKGVASLPTIRVLEGDENRYICARGAGLAVVRDRVHRRFSWLFGEDGEDNPEGVGNKLLATTRIRELTYPYVPARGAATGS